MRLTTLCVTAMLCASPALADMKVQLLGGWDGKKVPAGQQCDLFGGRGSTPPMQVSGVPEGTVMLVVEYNDLSFQKLSTKGGHGIIGYRAKPGTVKTPSVPGKTAKLPGGARVIKKARSTGKYASAGYLPPCSGGKGNRYAADVKAIDSKGKVIGLVKKVPLGRY